MDRGQLSENQGNHVFEMSVDRFHRKVFLYIEIETNGSPQFHRIIPILGSIH